MDAQEEDRVLIDDDADEPFVSNTLGYPVTVADDALPLVQHFLRARGQAFVVLADEHRALAPIAARLSSDPLCMGVRAFKLGEARKRLATVERVHEAMLGLGAGRDTLVLGIGGGVASDLFGFAAATYMRGVPYAHVATSLVAMVDAAVGGKTGVDLRAGKNLVGTFSDPVAVFAHVDALQTLPFRHIREGLAEVVKTAVIEGGDFFEALETLAPHPFWRWPWSSIVTESVRVKMMVVADDREERGMRELLNLGHTFGHALETASGYRITHGVGVALGLRAASMLALRTRRFSQREYLRLLGTIALLGMPLQTSVDPDATFAAMRSDKKRRAGTLRFVLPRAIGDVEYGVQVPDRLVKAVLAQLQRSPDSVG
ncbi:MAG: 3-dehydroquinate synthase [bacterium]|nr:3-dehydroquinate synthase [bacterium]